MFSTSFLNPIRYYQVNPAAQADYMSRHMDDFPFEQTILPWQEQTKFYQCWQLTDAIRQQFTSSVAPITLSILSDDGHTVFTDNFVQRQQNFYEPGTYLYEHSLDLSFFQEGVYFIQIKVGNLTLLSEPQIFLQKIESSLLVEYKHSKYISGIVFESGFSPSLRIPAVLQYKNPASKRTQYEDQILNMTLLDSKHYRIWTLHIGISVGVPDYFIDLISQILECSTVAIDGRLFTPADGAKLEPSEEENYPMRGWSIELREHSNQSGKVYEDITPLREHYIISVVDSKGFGLTNGSDLAIKDVE